MKIRAGATKKGNSVELIEIPVGATKKSRNRVNNNRVGIKVSNVWHLLLVQYEGQQQCAAPMHVFDFGSNCWLPIAHKAMKPKLLS